MRFAWEIKHHPRFPDETGEYAQLLIGGDRLIIHVQSPKILKDGNRQFRFYIMCKDKENNTHWIRMCDNAHYTNIQDAIDHAEHVISERFNNFEIALNN